MTAIQNGRNQTDVCRKSPCNWRFKSIMKLFHIILLGWACALAAAYASVAKAQEAEIALQGECIPHTPEQGPWDCKITQRRQITCIGGKERKLDSFWVLVDGQRQVEIYVKLKYEELNNLRAFSLWLACQDFNVDVLVNSDADGAGEEKIALTATHGLKDGIPIYNTNNLGWYLKLLLNVWPPYGGFLELNLDEFGQISRIRYSETSL